MTLRFLQRALLNVLLALLGFFVVAEVIRVELVPPPEDMRAKLEYFEQTRDLYDAVYIGSSRIARGIRPDVVDPILSSPDRPFRSFNLGFPAMRSYEINYLMEYVLALEPERLRYLVVEAPTWKPAPTRLFDAMTERWVAWHTPKQSFHTVLSTLENRRLTWTGRLAFIGTTLSAMSYRQSNFGLGPLIARELVSPRRRSPNDNQTLLHWFGYSPRSITPPKGRPQHGRSFTPEKVEAYLERLEKFSSPPTRFGALLHRRNFDVRAMTLQRRVTEENDVHYQQVIPPADIKLSGLRRLRMNSVLEGAWNFARPDLYPELFVVENRFDLDHLNDYGAEAFSRGVAERLLELEEAAERR